MDCRTFRQLHGLWLDGGLAPRHAARLLSHVGDCEDCARFDALVRRALLVARNTDAIAPSADFGERLKRRLAEERLRCAVTDAGLDAIPEATPGRGLVPLPWRAAAAIALVAGGAMLGAAATGGGAHGGATFDSAGIGAAGPSWTALAAPSSFATPLPVTAAPESALVPRATPGGTIVPVATTAPAPVWARSAGVGGRATPVRTVVQLH